MRIGAKKRPFYRVVVIDERAKRSGAYIENVGTYNPLTNPKEIILKKDRIEHWLKMGAVKSDGFLRILGEAPQKPPRAPKKAKKEEKPSVVIEKEVVSSQPSEEVKTEETPKEGVENEVVSDQSSETTPEDAKLEPMPTDPSVSPQDDSQAEPTTSDVIPSGNEESVPEKSISAENEIAKAPQENEPQSDEVKTEEVATEVPVTDPSAAPQDDNQEKTVEKPGEEAIS